MGVESILAPFMQQAELCKLVYARRIESGLLGPSVGGILAGRRRVARSGPFHRPNAAEADILSAVSSA